ESLWRTNSHPCLAGQSAATVREVFSELPPFHRLPPVVAHGGGSAPYPLVLREHRRAVSSRRAASGAALVFQPDWARAGLCRSLCVWRPRHQSLLSSVADTPWIGLPEMAGVRLR